LTPVNYVADASYLGKVFSPWITLQADQKYYIEGTMNEAYGTEHFSVGVEIAPTDPSLIPADHP
jgi:hypothetical protein